MVDKSPPYSYHSSVNVSNLRSTPSPYPPPHLGEVPDWPCGARLIKPRPSTGEGRVRVGPKVGYATPPNMDWAPCLGTG